MSKAICACAILLIQIDRAEKLMRAENRGDEKQVIDLEWPKRLCRAVASYLGGVQVKVYTAHRCGGMFHPPGKLDAWRSLLRPCTFRPQICNS